MSNRIAKKAPIVRLPPKSNVELLLLRSAQVAVIVMGLVAAIFALAGRRIYPGARQPRHRAWPDARTRRDAARKARPAARPFRVAGGDPVHRCDLPVCGWPCRAARPSGSPACRSSGPISQLQLSELKGPLEALKSVRDQLRELTGGEGLTVSVDEGMGVESMAILAPAVVAQILIFFACLYFFVATRHQTRTAILKLCLDRRLRWRVAHIFRDVEQHGVALPSVDHHHQHPGGRSRSASGSTSSEFPRRRCGARSPR